MATPTLCCRCGHPMDLSRQTHTRPDGSGRRHYNRGECNAAEGRAREAVANRATSKQVDYAETLQRSYWTPAVYERRYEHAEFVAMSRAKISGLIDALVAERFNQGD